MANWWCLFFLLTCLRPRVDLPPTGGPPMIYLAVLDLPDYIPDNYKLAGRIILLLWLVRVSPIIFTKMPYHTLDTFNRRQHMARRCWHRREMCLASFSWMFLDLIGITMCWGVYIIFYYDQLVAIYIVVYELLEGSSYERYYTMDAPRWIFIVTY